MLITSCIAGDKYSYFPNCVISHQLIVPAYLPKYSLAQITKAYSNKAMIWQKSAYFKAATLQSTDHQERGRSIKAKLATSNYNIIRNRL
jgi:hypothetical protein